MRLADAKSLFTEPGETFPDHDGPVWWEAWLRKGSRERFQAAALHLDMLVRDYVVEFVERDVMVVRGSASAISRIVSDSDVIAELRLARDTPAFFMDQPGEDQAEWTDELLERVVVPGVHAPAVCILDTGTARQHPLIDIVLRAQDEHAYDRQWGGDDRFGHGTRMAGTAIYGDLAEVLQGNSRVELGHLLEFMTIPKRWGKRTTSLRSHHSKCDRHSRDSCACSQASGMLGSYQRSTFVARTANTVVG